MSTLNSGLVIDDDRHIFNALNLMLSDIYLEHAASIDEGLRMVKSDETYDLAFIDYHLGDGNGTTLIPKIKEFKPSTKIIVFTGDPTGTIKEESLRMGAHGFVLKPPISSELESEIERLFPNRS